MIEWMIIILACVMLLTLVIPWAGYLYWYLRFFRKDFEPGEKINTWDLPQVAIFVAARNEEAHIGNCIRRLGQLEYPPQKINIYLGNDGSTDNTEELMRHYANQFTFIHYFNIISQKGEARGKANVLAQLVEKDQMGSNPASIYLFTDADVQVNKHWVIGLLTALKHTPPSRKIGIVNGFTLVINNRKFACLQNLDWLTGQVILKILSDLDLPLTAVGNNMLITRSAYDATGGYENIPFSVTEDHALFRAVAERGFGTISTLNEATLGLTQPEPSWRDLVKQRIRWMYGALQTPWFVKLAFMLIIGYYPLVFIALGSGELILGFLMFFCKWISQCIFVAMLYGIFGKKAYSKVCRRQILWHDFFAWALNLNALFIYIYFNKITWKGRGYSKR